MREDLKEQIRNMPPDPGVYRYYDREGKLLYVGKARNLKKRVTTYFTQKGDASHRIRLMVSKIAYIEYTVVASEYDALLLENNLIKEHQPRYNINLRDDKTYPFIVLTGERFPRLFVTRNPSRKGNSVFGPYASVVVMRTLLELIKKLFTMRSCSYVLSRENISKKKFRVCLDYHIGQCKGPCEGLQTEEDYSVAVANIRQILSGNLAYVNRHLTDAMKLAIDRLDFEEAQSCKEKLEMLEKFQAKSTIVSPALGEMDVFNIYSNEHHAFVSYLKVIHGTIISTDTIQYRKKFNEDDYEVLQVALAELRQRYNSTTPEIIVPFPILLKDARLKFTVPKVGDKKKLLELCRRNAVTYFNNKLKSIELNAEKRKNTQLLTQMKNDLGLKHVPYHLECFDNSNLLGTNPISAVVVFKNGQPSKKDYRYFNVRSVQGANDFATMEEAVYRRYRKLIETQEPLPQLIVIDGGKGQLSSAMKSLAKLGITDQVDVVGIAKRLEEIYKPGDPLPLSINKKSPSLRLIQRARDEAHRFGITRHRQKRISTSLTSQLTEIPGIGKKTTEKLLTYFKSVKKMREASEEEIVKAVGKARAQLVIQQLRGNQ